MLRFINGVSLADKVESKQLLENSNMLLINQLNAQIKMLEMWKVKIVENYPTKCKKEPLAVSGIATKAYSNGRLVELGVKTLTLKTCKSNGIRLGNSITKDLQDFLSFNLFKN